MSEIKERLQSLWPALSSVQVEKVVHFYGILKAENEKQNLTRLISPKDFVEGHVWDVRELHESGLTDYPAMDLGSGGGIPGLLSAILGTGPWVLAESEKRKAEFLAAATKELGPDKVSVYPGRGEEFLKKSSVSSVVARAVGPVERIYTWLGGCSTWNNLILFKGPGWAEEWKTFKQSKFRKHLEIEAEYNYTVGEEKKERQILKLKRVR